MRTRGLKDQLWLEDHHNREEILRSIQQLTKRIAELKRIKKEILTIVSMVGIGQSDPAYKLLWAYVRQCCGKEPYLSEDIAKKAMASHKSDNCDECKKGKTMNYYPCSFCGKYHIGHGYEISNLKL